MKSIKGLRRRFGRLRKSAAIPEIQPVGIGGVLDLLPPDVEDLLRVLGRGQAEQRLAKRLMTLKAQYPEASLPELVTFDWLRLRQERFEFQASMFGGRQLRGGAVPDFTIFTGGGALVWRVQGEYWHTQPGTRVKDFEERVRMLGGIVGGQRVIGVVDLWEDDIYRRRPGIFLSAMAGIGLRN